MSVTARKPFTKRERHRWTQNGLGYRPTNNWGSGDLPAPWAEGDVVELIAPVPDEGDGHPRMRGMTGPFFVVVYATSIDEGDGWYFRVRDGGEGYASDRLHVVYAERSEWDTSVDWMAPFRLVESADPEGLALREQMIADGWAYTAPRRCGAVWSTRMGGGDVTGERGPHEGGWVVITIEAEHGGKVGTDDLFDALADVVFAWGEKHGIDPYIGGQMNADPPEWMFDEADHFGSTERET